MARKSRPPVSTGVSSAVDDAFGGMEELKDELQSWYDNLPENFQNGDKGSQLQEAIDAIDGVYQIDVPDAAEGLDCSYVEDTGKSRSARRNTCVAMINAAAEAARDQVESLNALEYDEDGNAVDKDATDLPGTEDERDSAVSELETFADECESAASEWEGVEFPGMYG